MYSLWETVKAAFLNLLQSLGLKNKQGSLLLLGLDNAGKTTLLYRLKTGGEVRPFPPTDRPSMDDFSIRTGASNQTIHFKAWDLGGHEVVRHLWEDYMAQVSAVVFLIDASDSARLEEAAYELDALISEGSIQGIPMAILLNKCDLESALETEEVCERIEFSRLQAEYKKTRTADVSIDMLCVFRISVLKGEGYTDAFRWIATFL